MNLQNFDRYIEATKEDIFNKLIDEALNERYEGWMDWRLELLGICSMISYNPQLRSVLDKQLVSMVEINKDDSWSNNYVSERVNLIRYQIIKNYDGEKSAQLFIDQNLQYSHFREMAITKAMKDKDYEQVTKLALDGEEKDKSLLGLVKKWKEYRYNAYRLSGKLELQRSIALDFIMNGSYDYYKELKNTYECNGPRFTQISYCCWRLRNQDI